MVVSLLWRRYCYELQLLWLGVQRAWRLGRGEEFLLYSFWLVSGRGWRRSKVRFFRYYNSLMSIIFQALWFLFLVYGVTHFNIGAYSEYIFGYFGAMELSYRGYFGYTVVVCCTLSWFLQLALWSSSRWLRDLLKPYRVRLVTVNLVIFLVLLSIGAQVARAKLGLRVWYPNERVYGERVGAAYWD